MKRKAIIYLHGFNSASLDLEGNLLTSKDKLKVMLAYCSQKDIVFEAPNVDYRDFQDIVEEMLLRWNQYLDQGYDVVFMGSSMGGFTSEYLAMKTGAPAIMINPALTPSELLSHFIGVKENFETGQPYHWDQQHCDQYRPYEQELTNSNRSLDRTILLDKADELLDTDKTLQKYQDKAQIVTYEGGSHGFEHMRESLPVIDRVIFAGFSG